MDTISSSNRSPDRSVRCGMCGHYMTKFEYGGIVRGEYIHFTEKKMGSIIIPMCGECLHKVLEIADTETELAI